MWKAIKPVLAQLFSSKKFLAMLVGVLVWAAGKAGLHLSDADLMPVLVLIGTYIGAQGLSDVGKEKAKVLAEAIEKKPQPPQDEP